MAQIDDDIQAIYKFLAKQKKPYAGTSSELAEELRIDDGRFWTAVNRIRSASFIADRGWTIPYVPKGTRLKSWMIATGGNDSQQINDALDMRDNELVELLRRAHAQSNLSARADAKSREGRYARYVQTMLASMLASGEQMLETADSK